MRSNQSARWTLSPAAILRPAALTLLGALSTATLSGCHSSQAGSTAAAEVIVRVMHAEASRTRVAEYTGSIHARIESDLGFRVGGKIAERLVDPGALVRRSQPLMRLDPTNLSLSAKAAEERLIAARADATRAAAEEERQKGLLAQGAISSSSYEAALAIARASAALVVAAEASRRDAGLDRDYATLVADADGVVVEVLANPGEVVSPGSPIVRLARSGERDAVVAIPETQVKVLPEEASAVVYGTSAIIPARLRYMAGAADPVSRTFSTRYALRAPADALPLGATVTVRVQETGHPSIRVPLAALADLGGGPGVWVLNDGAVHFRAVRVERLGGETIDIAPGTLRPGEPVVALGASRLREGERVRAEGS